MIVGYDGSAAAEAALTCALDEGRRFATRVRLVYVLDSPVYIEPTAQRPMEWPDSQFRRDAEAAVEEAAAKAARSAPDVNVRAVVLEGPVAATLCALSTRARMVVLGHGGRGGFSGLLLLSSVAPQLLHHAHCPVAVVREIGSARE